MRIKLIVSMLLFCFAVFLAASSFGQEAKTAEPPVSQIKPGVEESVADTVANGDAIISATETEYKFSTVLDGVEVTHDFTIQNKGTAELKIQKVKTG